MGDEKVPPDGQRKDVPPPAMTKPSAPTQETGPGRATEKKPTEEKKPVEDKKPATGAVPQPTTPPKQAAEQATQLQQAVGNQEANRLMRAARDTPGTPALPVSHPNDKSEKEAEALAKKVTEERPPHPRDHPAPAPGDPTAIQGDPQEVTGDPEQARGTVHRAARTQEKPQPPPPPAKGADQTNPTAILNNPGPGERIPQPTRGILERKLNVNLSHVTIHHDAKADAAVRALNAKAVTRGNHIWLASDASPNDLNLMAHEVAHVLQRDNHVVRRQPQTTPAQPGAATQAALTLPDDLDPAEKKAYRGPGGKIDTAGSTLVLDEAYVPAFKVGLQGPLRWNPAKRGDSHKPVWATAAAAKLQPPITQRAADTNQKTEPFYFERTGDILVFGTAADISNALSTIPWDKSGKVTDKKNNYQIDHRHEFQLGGPENEITNLWLLARDANSGSGSAIMKSVTLDLEAFLRAAAPKLINPPAAGDVKGRYALTFTKAAAGPNPRQNTASPVWTRKLSKMDFWELEELASPDAAKPLRTMSPKNREKVEGKKGTLSISTRRGGGKSGMQSVPYNATSGKMDVGKLFLRGAYKVVSGTYTGGDSPPPPGQNVGEMLVIFFPDNGELTDADRTFPIMSVSGVNYGGLLDTGAIRELGKQLKHKKASPIDLTTAEFDFEHGLVGRGIIPTPSIKLLQNVQLGVVIEGKDVGLEATISGGDLKLPGPFKINGGSLTLAAATGGFSVDGRIDFEIQKLAKGYVKAMASSNGRANGFELDGKLMFDTKMFTKAELGLSYKDGKWGVNGELEVGPNKIKGIKSALATVDVKDETVTAEGKFETSIKGVDKGKLGFRYQEAAGMEVTGELLFGEGIPGIRSGKLDATVKEGPEGWSLSGGVTAEPSVPGLSGSIGGKYDNGIFLVEADLAYQRGLATGTMKVGITNQPLDPKQKPGAGKPDGKSLSKSGAQAPLRLYGGGTITIKLTSWLQGTVGVMLEQDGSVTLSGKVAVPDTINLFDAMEINKNLLEIGADIPIIGVAFAGARIGIFATVQGGLEASAGIGPGQLREASLEVDYNPEHEEKTAITGRAKLFVPAHAGLRLYIQGGVGAGIVLVSANAGLEVGAQLGLEGAAEAGVEVNWSRAKGLTIDAQAAIYAEPKLKFDVSAFVKVEAGIGFLSTTIYEDKWQLAQKEFGSGLRIGVHAPVHYEEGKPFSFKAEDVHFDVPEIKPEELIGGLVKEITGG